MNIVTEKIYMNRAKSKNTYQITVDDDFIVSDTKPDLDKIIREQGEVIIDEYKLGNGKIDIKGKVKVYILYLTNTQDTFLNCITEVINFNEIINMPDVLPDSIINIRCELEDLSINLINSRKVSVKGLISIYMSEEEVFSQNAAVSIDGEVEAKNEKIDLTQLVTSKKDIFRIKEEVLLQSSKKNINNILYYDVKLTNCSSRIMDEKIGLKGDLITFVLYDTDEGEYECLEKEIPFSGEIDLFEAKEEMIDDIEVKIADKNIMVKEDEDGENRVIDVDITLDLNIKIYKEESINVLKDVYSTKKYLSPNVDTVEYVNLLMKNDTSFRINEKVELKENYKNIMQICNSVANIKVDDIEIVDNGISIEGAVEANVLYISSDDKEPMNSFKEMVPFTHLIEVKDININCIYDIRPYIEQINVSMITRDEIEIKVSVGLNTLVFNKQREDIIVDVTEREFTNLERNNMCSMVGYRVKEKDSLWDIAKKYYTTVDMLKEVNEIVDNNLRKGDMLLIVRENIA